MAWNPVIETHNLEGLPFAAPFLPEPQPGHLLVAFTDSGPTATVNSPRQLDTIPNINRVVVIDSQPEHFWDHLTTFDPRTGIETTWEYSATLQIAEGAESLAAERLARPRVSATNPLRRRLRAILESTELEPPEPGTTLYPSGESPRVDLDDYWITCKVSIETVHTEAALPPTHRIDQYKRLIERALRTDLAAAGITAEEDLSLNDLIELADAGLAEPVPAQVRAITDIRPGVVCSSAVGFDPGQLVEIVADGVITKAVEIAATAGLTKLVGLVTGALENSGQALTDLEHEPVQTAGIASVYAELYLDPIVKLEDPDAPPVDVTLLSSELEHDPDTGDRRCSWTFRATTAAGHHERVCRGWG